MEIKKYFDIIKKRLWLIIALPVLVGIIAGYLNFFVFVPIYQADTTLLITGLTNGAANTDNTNTAGNNMSFEDIIAGQTLISEYSAIISSKRVTSAVVKELNNPDITEEDLSSMISINSVNETRIIDISIVDTDPVEAAKIADIVAKVFSQEIVSLYRIENVDVIDKAEVPRSPIAPEKKKNIALAGFVAVVFAIGIILLLEFLNTKIKSSEDVETHLGLNVLGNIPVDATNKGRKR
ncbi:MAG TPA: Wzz/FepE/Etk N-terminal domain-containing protein [Clostridia bacterium]|nr:Wzz/FepE/Etk N-terminal domain-containing protein [Clostridia bacterium]